MKTYNSKEERIEKNIVFMKSKRDSTKFIQETSIDQNGMHSINFSDNVLDKKQIFKSATNDYINNIFKEPSINDSQKSCLTKVKTFSSNILVASPNLKEVFSYTEPLWSGKPQEIYKLEVLKSGQILEIINISNKNYHVIGRLPTCDISMAHPTISRYHAIIQYRIIEDKKNEKGMYIYDLGSTHGTFWNGNRIKPKMYIRLQNGHIIRFGCSQRKFIVQTPLNDQEQESEYSVTELKELRKLMIKKNEKLEKLEKQKFKEKNEKFMKPKHIEGIDWGMGEDADEETDLTENPYAQTNNEELFLDDPKKTLRGWFDREGYDLQYHIEDKGIGKFLCYINLPIDHNIKSQIRAEVLLTGKKKEAVVQCALEACRILDRHGLLRQANHETRKKKSRNWKEEDYYDSDEDNFLDRTGIIEKKREQRMRLAGNFNSKAETYNSLIEKHLKVTAKITQIENAIALQKLKRNETYDANMDILDAYMTTLESPILNKMQIREMKMDLFNFRKEEAQLLKLINISKSANLPPLKPHVSNAVKKTNSNIKYLRYFIGQKKIKLQSSPEKCVKISNLAEVNVNTNKCDNQELVDKLKERFKKYQQSSELFKHNVNNKNNLEHYFKNENTIIIKLSENNMKSIEDKDIFIKKNKNIKLNQEKIENARKHQANYDEDKFREDYSIWLPPENQCGDGKTNLNDKFGY